MAEETGGQTTTASKTNLQQREAVDANWRMAERVLAGGSPGEWACPGWKVPCVDGVLGRCVRGCLECWPGGYPRDWKILRVSYRPVPSAVTLPNLSFRYGILLNTTLCGILLYPLNLIVVSTLIMLPFICESYFEESRMTELKMICAVLTIT